MTNCGSRWINSKNVFSDENPAVTAMDQVVATKMARVAKIHCKN
jgi:hypothetical protein